MSGYVGPRRVLSGVQPSGGMHLGNYLGALVNFVRMQKDYQCFYMIADIHALMQPYDPKKLRDQTLHIAASFIASGIDPVKSTIFAQSTVKAHAELGWIFQGVARLGWLDRMTQFKDKAGKNAERAAVGLYTYPVLQAADILVYKATHVPVGEDQKQHLELSRDIAAKFNHDYEAPDFFPLPEPLIQGPAARVMSLRDGTKKMSKSDTSEMASIFLSDDADTIGKKIKKATTDSEPLPSEELGLEGRAEASNLVGLYAALTETSKAAVLRDFGGKGFGAFKPALADLVVAKLGPVSAEMRRLEADPSHLEGVLRISAERAAQTADPVVRDVKARVGLFS